MSKIRRILTTDVRSDCLPAEASAQAGVVKRMWRASRSLRSQAKNNKTIHADLLFIDPPYNLNKDFGNNKFRIKKAEEKSNRPI